MAAATPITTVLFDYGGVLAEEGFALGLAAIARENGLDPDAFFHTAGEAIYGCGYVTGRSTEQAYWQLVRSQTGIRGEDRALTEAILSRFTLRPRMLDAVRALKAQGVSVLLSEQNLPFAEAVADRAYLIEQGQVVHEGRMADVVANPDVRKNCLGV